MKKIVLPLLMGIALVGWEAQARIPMPDKVQITAADTWELPGVFQSWLLEEGFRPKQEVDDHFITYLFKYQGRDMQLAFSKDDRQFYNLVDYIVMSSENTGQGGSVSEEDMYLRLQVVNQVSSELKVVKAYLDEDADIVLRIELFDDGTPNPKAVMERYLDVLSEAIQSATNLYWRLKKDRQQVEAE